MPDNPQPAQAVDFALPYRVIALTGRDALAFAQAQFMNDVATLADGAWQWSGWLDPKGRVQALFALLRRDAETLWVVTAADADALVAALRRFVFRSKVSIATLDVHAHGRLSPPACAVDAMSAMLDDGTVELDLSGDAGARTLRLASAAVTEDAGDAATWWSLDVAHGWPALPGVALDAWTPQQLSLQRLNAFSVKKGCYPGQEIVARTHFLGRAKRGSRRVVWDASPAGNAVIIDDGSVAGTIVAHSGCESLAVLPLDVADDTRLHADGVTGHVAAFADGLSR